MPDQEIYVSLSSATMSPCDLVHLEYERARSTWLCTGCCVPKPGINTVDVTLQSAPTDKPLNFVSGCGLPVIHTDFLDLFPQALVSKDLHLGKVYGPNRDVLSKWVTFRGKSRLIIRGSKNISYRKCTDCGRDVYFAMGNKYLHTQPPSDVELFESDSFGIILRAEIFSKLGIDTGKFRKLYVDKLPVLNIPEDELGILQYY